VNPRYYFYPMKFILLLLSGYLITYNCFAQQTSPDPQYKLISGGNYVQSKNYYLLTLFNELPEVKKLLTNDQQLSSLTAEKRIKMNGALKNCDNKVSCYIDAVKFGQDEIQHISKRLGEMYQKDNELSKLVKQHLIPSGCYSLFSGIGEKEMLIKAWEQDAKALNFTIGVYAEGKKPNYDRIDSISFNVRSKGYPELLSLNTGLSLDETKNNDLFFSPVLTFALHSLEINRRNRAADVEPMGETVNKMAVDYAKKIKWEQYKYTLILVPGAGPDDKDTELSAQGMLRCRLAAVQYQKGLAPFVMVSGGCVHPYQTKYNEAIEMKKFMIDVLHLPEKAILLEPHARHTTTNLRNCARLIFRYGFPMNKPCISSTAKSQSFYITDVVPERCIAELGYVPYKNGKRLSDTEAEFYPLAAALQIDFDEPMDP